MLYYRTMEKTFFEKTSFEKNMHPPKKHVSRRHVSRKRASSEKTCFEKTCFKETCILRKQIHGQSILKSNTHALALQWEFHEKREKKVKNRKKAVAGFRTGDDVISDPADCQLGYVGFRVL